MEKDEIRKTPIGNVQNTDMVDALREELTEIENASKKAGKILFYGGFKKNPETKILWKNNLKEKNDYKEFLNSFIETSTKILVINTEINKVDIDMSLDEFTKDCENDDEKQSSQEMYENVSKTKGFIMNYKLIFIVDGWCYEFQRSVEWVKDYHDMKDIFSDNIFNVNTNEDNFTPISEPLKEEIARNIIIDEVYLNSKSILERREIACKIAAEQDVDHWYNQKLVAEKAESIFITEIKPKQDAELKVKIQKLKDNGYTKVKIKGELGITQSTLDKLYY